MSHSLQRVVFLVSVTSLMSLDVFSGYVLNSGPYTRQDLGVLIASCSQEHQEFFVNTNGDAHLFLNFFGGARNDLVDVNLTQGVATRFDGITGGGRLGVKGVAYGNGMIYYATLGVYLGPVDKYRSVLQSYDISSGTTNLIGLLTQNGGYYMTWGDDGWLYVGSYSIDNNGWDTSGAELVRYDPDTDTLEDFGKIDPEHAGEVSGEYAYYIEADTNFCYVAMGLEPFYLAIVNTVTDDRTNYFYSDGDTYCQLYRSTNGPLWYRRVNGGTNLYYALSNGVPVLTNSLPGDVIPFYIRGGMVDSAGAYTNTTGFNFDFEGIYPNSSNNVSAVGYETNGTGVWTWVTTSNFTLTAATIRRLYPDGTNLFLLTFQYGPWLGYTPATSNVTLHGTAPYSMYDAVKIGDKWYVSGYTAATLEYDPLSAWTMTSANKTDPSANPRKVGLAMRTHEYFSGDGSDGLLYVAAHHSRDSVGGEIGWYNPATENYDTLRDPFATNANDVADLKPILGGSNFVYSSLGSNLYVFDTETKTLLSTNTPLGVRSPGMVVDLGGGTIIGFSGTNVYKWNCNSNALIWSNNVSATLFGNMEATERRVELGPDGFCWLTISNTLNRVSTENGSTTPIYTNSAALKAAWYGTDLYLYGGNNLYRIQNLLTYNIGAARIGTVRAGQITRP